MALDDKTTLQSAIPDKGWNDRTKFLAETIRTIVLGFAGAALALYIVKPWEKSLDYRATLDTMKLEAKTKAVDTYLVASYYYAAQGYDVCLGPRSNSQNDQKKWQDALSTFESKSVDDLRSARDRLDVYFRDANNPDIEVFSAEIKDIKIKEDGLHNLCRSGHPNKDWKPSWNELKQANQHLAVEALRRVKFYSPEPN
jgi:hypothetical protein